MSSSTVDLMSLYIPYVPKNWNTDSMARLFMDMQIGVVERVDFFDAGNWQWALGAFVHLKCWSYSDYADQVYEGIQTTGQWHLYIPGQQGKYFVLKRMTCPKIPATHLNVHQLAAKMTDMEQELQSLREETLLLKSGIVASSVAENVLRDDVAMNMDSEGFYTEYEDSGPLSMSDLVSQTEEFFQTQQQKQEGSAPMDISGDEGSVDSEGSSSSVKRMRFSADFCGNN